MKFQNVNILVNALEQNEYIRSMQYCWLDKHGAVCQQKGVFRVNCIDCLDRTNVVQTAIAKNVIETQLIKLGLIPPEHGIPVNLRLTIQVSSQKIIWYQIHQIVSPIQSTYFSQFEQLKKQTNFLLVQISYFFSVCQLKKKS